MGVAGPYQGSTWPGYPPSRRRLHWIVVAIASAFVMLAVLAVLLVLFPTPPGSTPRSSTPHFGLLASPFGLLFLLFVGFFVIRIIFWSARVGRRGQGYGWNGPGGYGPDRAARVARMRYARGEITRDQFDQIMVGLGRPPGPR